MKIAVFGLGYVGAVSGACFAKSGHEVIGVDCNEQKVALIRNGQSPIIEEGIAGLIADVASKNLFTATTDTEFAVFQSDISIVCVGTPSRENGSLELESIINVCQEIGQAIRKKNKYHIVVIRSTVLPGTIESVIVPLIESHAHSQLTEGFDICSNPEFMREGTSIADFFQPPFVLIGSSSKKAGKFLEEAYKDVDAEIIHADYKVAEMVKYVCNSFHAVKISFANEIGAICKKLQIDSHRVMDIMCRDSKLNISKAYLRPGFSFGGSCLPKDLRALTYKAKELDEEVPLLVSIMQANQVHLFKIAQRIVRLKKKTIGLVGLSFKEGTDDLRESPLVLLAEYLLGKGYVLKIFDSNISLARLIGANKDFIEREIPHLSAILTDKIEDIISASEVIVVGNKDKTFIDSMKLIKKTQIVFDLTRVPQQSGDFTFIYDGICW